MKEIFRQAKALQQQLVSNRRYLHENAEVGFDLPKTCAFVEEKLCGMGYKVEKCAKNAFVATLGRGESVLLRADMDALPMAEQTKLPYACTNGRMHACGHDMHTTMLLGAAKLLKNNEEKLSGGVTLLFQPAEEILEGAQKVVESGALEKYKVAAAFAMHVTTGTELPTGAIVMQKGVGAPSADYFTIEIRGKGCHGSSPWEGIDPVPCAARIVLGLQEIFSRELSLQQRAVLTVGSLQTGDAGNVIPETVFLKGTLRAYDEITREWVKSRLKAISSNIAKAFRCKALTSFQGGAPTLINDEKVTAFAYETLSDTLGEKRVTLVENSFGGASEDFAYIAREVPSVMLGIAAGSKAQGYEYGLHNPQTQFDEEVLWQGAAVYATLALSAKTE